MKVYLVGGAVRDLMMGREPKDRDYVVVGATPEEMIERGFTRVGADFPVFLHPRTGEEFALARQERKTGPGYHGFETRFDPDVTIEDDLYRRDLTINAMALPAEFADCVDLTPDLVIDPHGGLDDLAMGVLRHVSEAFAEDPVRVLRVARFAARYGFRIVPTTMNLMRKLVEAGELDHLTPERVWSELEKALMETQPDLFFKALHGCDALHVLFPGLDWPMSSALLRAAGQHMKVENRFAVMMLEMDSDDAEYIFREMKVPSAFVTRARRLRHLVNNVRLRRDAKWVLALIKDLDAFRNPDEFRSVCYATLAIDDHLLWEATVRLGAQYERALEVSFASLTQKQRETLQGPAIGAALDELRIEAIAEI